MFSCFQTIFGLNINFNKSEMVRIGDKCDECRLVPEIECKIVSLPIKYLGVPLEVKYKDLNM